MSSPPTQAPVLLCKQKSWTTDSHRDDEWLRKKAGSLRPRSGNVTDKDLDELRACIELGFGFDSPEMDQRLCETFPAYGLYYAVNKQYHDAVSKHPPSPPSSSASPSPIGSSHPFFGPGENPEIVKTRLRQWAQLVACSLLQSST